MGYRHLDKLGNIANQISTVYRQESILTIPTLEKETISVTINTSKILCPHFEGCSGCVLNDFVDNPPILKEVHQFFELHGFKELKEVAGEACSWRCRAKLAVRGTKVVPLVGLFKEHSHEVFDIPNCQVHHPSINKAANIVRQWIQQEAIEPYVEASGKGELRYLQLVVQRVTGQIQLALVVNAPALKDIWDNRLQQLKQMAPGLWHSLWINVNSRRDNVIFGCDWRLHSGDPWLWEMVGSVQVAFTPATFGQANLNLFEELLRELKGRVPERSRIAEFYAGVGVIGMNLVHKSEQVLCCELNRHGEACFKTSLERLAPELRRKITFEYGQAGDLAHWVDQVDLVIVDPPRRGLDEPLLRALTARDIAAKRLIYVSCGWNSFQRHAEALLATGWRVTSATAYLLFPGTNQVELLTIFDHA